MSASVQRKSKNVLVIRRVKSLSRSKGASSPGYISYDDIKKVNDALLRKTGKNSTYVLSSEPDRIKAIVEKASASITPQKINDAWKKAHKKFG